MPTFASLQSFKWLACAYLFLAGAVLYAWMVLSARNPTSTELMICVLPLVLGIALARTSGHDRRQYVARLLACVLFAPFLLMMWGISVENAAGSSSPGIESRSAAQVTASLDQDRLFAGAVAVQDVPLQAGAMTLLRGGAFRDASELRLMRFVDAGSAAQYLAMLAQTLGGERVILQGRSGVRLHPATAGETLTILVEQHGRDLVEVRAGSESLAVARLVAQGVAAPAPLPPQSANTGEAKSSPAAAPVASPLPFAIGFVATHLIVFVLLILWSGAVLTRVQPAETFAPVTSTDLKARLASLAESDIPATITAAESTDDLVFDYRFPDDLLRSHRIALQVDPDKRLVRVRETTSAGGDAPRTAQEADMRPTGSIGIDPKRPTASRVWAMTRQTTMIEPGRLVAVPVQLHRTRALLDQPLPEWNDPAHGPEALVHLLCAVVVRSGFVWQPVFFK